jgi:hypothetical protein
MTTGLPQNLELMLTSLAENSKSELDLIRALADAIRRADEQMLREVRNVALQHEMRREAIFGELQDIAVRLCSLPARPVTHAIEQPHDPRALEAAPSNVPGDWRQAARNVDDEFEFPLNGPGPRH